VMPKIKSTRLSVDKCLNILLFSLVSYVLFIRLFFIHVPEVTFLSI